MSPTSQLHDDIDDSGKDRSNECDFYRHPYRIEQKAEYGRDPPTNDTCANSGQQCHVKRVLRKPRDSFRLRAAGAGVDIEGPPDHAAKCGAAVAHAEPPERGNPGPEPAGRGQTFKQCAPAGTDAERANKHETVEASLSIGDNPSSRMA